MSGLLQKGILIFLLSFAGYSEASQVIGNIDGISNNIITGWACQTGYTSSISVHVYLNGPAGTGTFLKSAVANVNSEPAVAAACSSTGTKYRFSIPLTTSELQAHQGKTVYIHGISSIGSGNLLINKSGVYSVPAPLPSTVKGTIDSVTLSGTDYVIKGWACQSYYTNSISVHVYVGGAAGTGTMLKAAVANLSSEPAVASACASTGTKYRFSIPLTISDRQNYQGKKIYIHGISLIGSGNLLLTNSGVFSVPAPPASAIKGNIDGVSFDGTNYRVTGWACQTYYSDPISVHVYVGGAAGTGTMISSGTANLSSTAAVSTACNSSGTKHNFNIVLSYSQIAAHPGSAIYVHGISPPSYNTGNLTISQSGQYDMPSSVDLSYFAAMNTGNDITIPSGLEVKINQSLTKGNVVVNGKLSCPYNGTYNVKADNLIVSGISAHLQCGTSSTPFPGNISFILKNNRPYTDSAKPGKEFVAMNGGTITLAGKSGKSGFVRLAQTAAPNAMSIVVDTPVQWQAGDTIIIAPSNYRYQEAETRQITSLSADKKTVYLNQGLSYQHWGQTESYSSNGKSWTLDERAEVADLSRNIKVMSESDSYTANKTGAHMMVMGTGSQAYVDNVEFTRVGQMGTMGRYPFHWHQKGNVSGQYIKNSSIHESYNRCVTIHGTHYALVENNTCYDHYGHGFFLEDGNERKNRLLGNLGILSRSVPDALALLESESDDAAKSSQLGRFAAPATFWISHPDNEISGNVAAGSAGTGFWMAFHTTLNCSLSTDCPPAFTVNKPSAEMDTLKFDDNIAHSSLVGITHDGGPNGGVRLCPALNGGKEPCNKNNPNDQMIINTHYAPSTPPTFNNLRAHKNVASGLYYRGNEAVYNNAVMADNGASVFFAYDQTVKDTLIVGLSNNHSVSDLNSLIYYPWKDKIVGALIYDGPLDLQNVHFAKFSSTPLYYNGQEYTPAAIKVMGAAARYISRTSGLSFAPSPARRFVMDINNGRTAPWRDVYAAVIHDTDGTLTGVANSEVRPYLGFNDHASCNTTAYDSTALVCQYETSHLRFATLKSNNTYYDSNNIAFDVQRTGGVMPQEEQGLQGKTYQNKIPLTRIPVAGGGYQYPYDYAITEYGWTPTSDTAIDMFYSTRTANQLSPIVSVNNLPAGCKVSNGGGAKPGPVLTALSSLPELRNFTDAAYYQPLNSKTLYFRLKSVSGLNNKGLGIYNLSCPHM